MSGDDVELRGRIVEVRELSVLFQEEGGLGLRVYLPKSQIAVVQDVDGRVKLTLPRWLAQQKQLY